MSGRAPTPPPRKRGTLTYSKPALPLDAIVARLKDRGLLVPDPEKARRYLRHIGYYRLSPYAIPFQLVGPDHIYRPGATFNDVLDLYIFDRELRLLVMDALERVEVATRAALTDRMATAHDDPHWYTVTAHFKDLNAHEKLMKIVRDLCHARLVGKAETTAASNGDNMALVHRSALEHYLMTYEKPELPPSWLMVENLTIGQLVATIRNLGNKRDKDAIGNGLGLKVPVMESWLRTYVRVRNICAHHGRLWNVGLGQYPMIPKSEKVSWLVGADALPRQSEQRLYPVLVSLQSILDTISPRSGWAQRLFALVQGRPAMNLAGMGMPPSWADDEFWQRHLED